MGSFLHQAENKITGIPLIVGALFLIVVAVNDKIGELGTLANTTFRGSGNKVGFLEWAAALLAISFIFRAVDLGAAGKAYGVLLIVVFVLANQDIPAKFMAGLQAGTSGDANAPLGPQSSGPVDNPSPLTNIAPLAQQPAEMIFGNMAKYFGQGG